MHLSRRVWAEIDLNAAKENFERIREHLGDKTKICAVVKADGYGHGANMLCGLYSELGADFFAVSNIDEAQELREGGIKEPILILGYTPISEASKLSRLNISQAVYSADYARMLSQKCEQEGITCKIHIKIDTGMSRLGFICHDFPENDSSIEEIKNVCGLNNLSAEGIFTHFAVSDESLEGRDFTNKQYYNMTHTIDELKKLGVNFDICHCSNSGAIIDYDMHLDMVRAGIILYGLSPSQKLKDKLNLTPVMTLKSVVSGVKTVPKGSDISYGRTYTTEKEMKIATVPIGYADGYIRDYGKDGYVFIGGKKAKILGRICMDQLICDVSEIENVGIGDEVIIFGKGENGEPTADDVAAWGNTINYEVICLISKRVPRLFFKDGKVLDVMYKI